jgi:hypothetical protein
MRTDMKHDFIPKGPPFSPEEIEAIVAAAPEYVYDPDCPYDPNNEAEVKAFWSKAKTPLPGQDPHQKHLRETKG